MMSPDFVASPECDFQVKVAVNLSPGKFIRSEPTKNMPLHAWFVQWQKYTSVLIKMSVYTVQAPSRRF